MRVGEVASSTCRWGLSLCVLIAAGALRAVADSDSDLRVGSKGEETDCLCLGLGASLPAATLSIVSERPSLMFSISAPLRGQILRASELLAVSALVRHIELESCTGVLVC